MNLLPAVEQTIGNEITGHPAGSEVEIGPVVVGQENTIGCHLCIGFEVMIGGMNLDAALTTTRIVPNQHSGFGIHGETQDALVGSHFLANLLKFHKDGIGICRFFEADFSGQPASDSPYH